jgi:Xaa-Pro dipeptidase
MSPTPASPSHAAAQPGDGPYAGLRLSDDELARRRTAVRALMEREGVEALLLYGSPGLDSEVTYLTDYTVTREAVLVVPATGEPTLYIEYGNHVPHARRSARGCAVCWGHEQLAETVADDVRQRGLARTGTCVGFAGLLPVQRYRAWCERLPTVTFRDLTPVLRRLRLVKSAEELALLRRGAWLTDLAVEALAREVGPGLTEYELVALIEAAYLGAGGQTTIHYLATTPMEAPERCVPAQQPSGRTVVPGDVLLTEISAHYRGYPGQVLRPFTIGADPTPRYQRMYTVAVETFERIAAILKAGTTTDEVLDAAEYIHREGFTICDDLLHGYGGGYLPPILRTRQTQTRADPHPPFRFEANMTVVIQPNVITPDGQAGVQVGELVCITWDGVERLHTSPMRFTRCG